MAYTFFGQRDNAVGQLSTAFNPGDSLIRLDPGQGSPFAPVSGASPIRVTLYTPAAIVNGAVVDPTQACTFKVYGISGDSLVSPTLEKGDPSLVFPAGSVVARVITQADFAEIHSAVNDALAAGTIGVSISSPNSTVTVGGTPALPTLDVAATVVTTTATQTITAAKTHNASATGVPITCVRPAGSTSPSTLDLKNLAADGTGQAIRVFGDAAVLGRPGTVEPRFQVNSAGGLENQSQIVCSGAFTGSGDTFRVTYPTSGPFMFGAWCDIHGPAYYSRCQSWRDEAGNPSDSHNFEACDADGASRLAIRNSEIWFGLTTSLDAYNFPALDTYLKWTGTHALATNATLTAPTFAVPNNGAYQSKLANGTLDDLIRLDAGNNLKVGTFNQDIYNQAANYFRVQNSSYADAMLLYVGSGTLVLSGRCIATTYEASSMPAFASNAAALGGGLAAGQFYRNGDNVCIVH